MKNEKGGYTIRTCLTRTYKNKRKKQKKDREKMKYTELIVTALLKEDMHFQASREKIAQLINKSMLKDEKLKVFHKENRYKGYVFNNFYPIESDKIYKKGNIYIFKIRTIQEEFAIKMKKYIKAGSDSIQVLAVESVTKKQRHIECLETVTPILITKTDKEPLINSKELMQMQKQLIDNLQKKYECFVENTPATQSFIQRIEVKGAVPLGTKYKGVTLLGHKIKLYVNDDEHSQNLAFLAEAVGLGEKNASVGAGFCITKFAG